MTVNRTGSPTCVSADISSRDFRRNISPVDEIKQRRTVSFGDLLVDDDDDDVFSSLGPKVDH